VAMRFGGGGMAVVEADMTVSVQTT